MNFDQRITNGGIIIPNLDGKTEGIHPRWGKVFAVGPEQEDVKTGQYVLVEHGRWSRGVNVTHDGEDMVVRRIDENALLMVSDEPVADEALGQAL
jgi:co-chaperonin GroES (HSP10)